METKQYPDMECDVVIAGCGVAGLYAALNLPTSTRVTMLSKGAIDECDSMLAQGGICVLPEGSDYDAFFEDTMHAGHYENRRESVDIMIRSSRSVINDLLAMGVDFERKADGSLDFTREGAILLNAAGERFTDELQPRDVVAAAIREQMKQDGTEHEWLSFAPVERDVVTGHFANIRARCLEDGRDILDEPIPVTPTQHYFMGGVWVDKDGRTSMPELYAAGETACNGVHGKNRLASNSLLEALVWGRRAAWYMRTGESLVVEQAGDPALDGRHRALSADTLAIDDLARAAGTQAVEE